jgi:aspartate kinase
MSGIVVQKYGGSSVADVDKLRRVARRVVETAKAGKRVCVVVSAMGDTTDELLELARKVSPAPPRRELDMLLSAGERISMSLLSMAIAELGCEAISFTGSQSGIITNDRHSGARIIEVRPYRIQDELERGRIVIVAGFQGVSYKKEVTTLGRGGSDTTAVALAAALGAEFCEICSDVDGVYSADPRVVEAPRLLEALSHDEMQELAALGAKVLNPQCVEFARSSKITIFARATAAPAPPSAERPGTRIGGPAAERRGAVGVTGTTGLVRLRLPAGGAKRARELAAALARDGVATLGLFSAGGEVTCLFPNDDLPDWTRVRERLAAAFGAAVTVEEELGAVSVVGEGLGSDPGALDKALEKAASLGIEIAAVETTPLRITLVCPPARVKDLVRALHQVFLS